MASLPHKIATSFLPRARFSTLIAASVNLPQPASKCAADLPDEVVRWRFSSMTPWLAQRCKSPPFEISLPRSSRNSRIMFCRLLGSGLTSGETANDSPMACPAVGYGSCPTNSTRTESTGCSKARITRGNAGATAASVLTFASISSSKSRWPASASCQLGCICSKNMGQA